MILSNNEPISDILKSIEEGKIQLPDFQRGWVWEDDRIRALIASISNGYPIGAAMFLQTGSQEVHFKNRVIEGVDKTKETIDPERLILDGQQRMTSIYRAMYSKKPVETTDSKKKPINRFYYLDIPKCLDTIIDRIDAIKSVPEDRTVRRYFNRVIEMDLSTRELEYANHCFPLNIIFDPSELMNWALGYCMYHHNETQQLWTDFFNQIVTPMTKYQIPVIKIGNDVPKEAVCQVFENVNQGGVSLTVFELVTASFAADNFELRKDWDKTWAELKHYRQLQHKKITAFSGTDFITAITLLASYYEWKKTGKAVSCKKRDVLRLTFNSYAIYRNRLIAAVKNAVKFLDEQRIFTAIDMPYTSQLIPLSVVYAIDPNLWFSIANKRKLEQWFWCGVFGELYGGANETRYVNDVIGLMEWVKDDNALPDTVKRSNFHASRLQQLYTRNSAAYKGVMALILKSKALDFISGSEMDFASYVEEATDIHHIFPQNYCEKQGIDRALWNSVINKTPLYARTNRIIGGVAPSRYISSLERNHNVAAENLNIYLASHQIDVEAIRNDDFDTYFKGRRDALLDLIEQATGKPISGRDDFNEEESAPSVFYVDAQEVNDTEN